MKRFTLLLAAVAMSLAAPSCKKEPVVSYGQLEWKDESFYLNGQPFSGIAQDRHPNGQFRCDYPMKSGRLHGLVREWYENGQLSVETHFEDGQRHGSNRYWDKDGRLTKEQMYDHGNSISEKIYPATPGAAAQPKQ